MSTVRTRPDKKYFIEEEFRKFCEREKGYVPCRRIYIDGHCSDYLLPLSDEEYADLAKEKGQKVVVYVDMPRARTVWDAIGIKYQRDNFIGVSFAADYNLLRECNTLGKTHTLWIAPTPKIMTNGGPIRYYNKFNTEALLLETSDFEEVIYALKYDIVLPIQIA
jgi:hypothetical protein